MKGKLIVAEGLDLSGKGAFIDEMERYGTQQGMRFFDADKYCAQYGHLPRLEDIEGHSCVRISEPTYQGMGHLIRTELISSNAKRAGRLYSEHAIAEAFSLDRLILIENFERPLRERGIHIIKSRSVISSLVYQAQQSKGGKLTPDEIAQMRGNALALKEDAPTHLFILTYDIEQMRERLSRTKKDDCIFETLAFQAKLKQTYEQEWLTQMCEEMGTQLFHVDTSDTLDATLAAARTYLDRIFGGEQ